jgi:hypothetical protein
MEHLEPPATPCATSAILSSIIPSHASLRVLKKYATGLVLEFTIESNVVILSFTSPGYYWACIGVGLACLSSLGSAHVLLARYTERGRLRDPSNTM